MNILVGLGFRQDESGNLVLPLDANPELLQARKLELENGLEKLQNRLEKLQTGQGQGQDDVAKQAPSSPSKRPSSVPVETR